jgi:SAM-dependent methyltransferase
MYCRSGHWRRTVRDALLPWVLDGVDLGDDLVEIGPGPGETTEILRHRVRSMTAVEIDPDLAEALSRRMAGTNVEVLHGDGSRLPFADGSRGAAVCFTMLHHVPSPQLQDRLLCEIARVLAPGGIFAGSDSMTSTLFRLFHIGDTLVPVDPQALPQRLADCGFTDVEVRAARRTFRFRGRKPPARSYSFMKRLAV